MITCCITEPVVRVCLWESAVRMFGWGAELSLLCVSVNALLSASAQFPVQLWIARLVIQQFYLLAFVISIHSAVETLLTDVFIFWSHRLCNRKYVQTTTLTGTLAFHRWLSTNLFLNIFMKDAGRKWFHKVHISHKKTVLYWNDLT